MRGEYANKFCVVAIPKGTTSACAENTWRTVWKTTCARNYLRVRGEYTSQLIKATNAKELPPRARRIQAGNIPAAFGDGTTSACAENTFCCTTTFFTTGNYLRVRGEYVSSGFTCSCWVELPPRARRILAHFLIEAQAPGTTSACAENTAFWAGKLAENGNYLRVRGEYSGAPSKRILQSELPPRARRIHS